MNILPLLHSSVLFPSRIPRKRVEKRLVVYSHLLLLEDHGKTFSDERPHTSFYVYLLLDYLPFP
jgi:hypothetical protein